MEKYKKEWFGNIKADVLSGMVVGIALIPEAIGFSILAGLDPMVGLYASFCIAFVTSFFGGRPGLISAATGAMALLLVGLVRDHGLQYVLAATLLAGLFQIIFGFAKIGNLLRFIPRPVMIGFVNALAIMIFKAQFSYFKGEEITMYLLVVGGIAIIYLFPKINKTIPAPLIAILVITLIAILTGMKVTNIGDVGTISRSLPIFKLPMVPFNLDTLAIIFPVSLSLAIVGLTESMLTAQLIDDFTDTKSNKNRECVGQGMANMVAGMFGGMAGCAMIGQSVINYKSGGRGRLSTFLSGGFLMVLILLLNKWVIQIPIAALVAVMIVVSISTFEWDSIKRLSKVPKTDTAVLFATILIVILTDNLAYGVIVGIIMSALFFVHKISGTEVEQIEENGTLILKCSGQLFFASTTHFIHALDIDFEVEDIIIDLSYLKLWDESAVDCIDKIYLKYIGKGYRVNIIGLSSSCLELLGRISRHCPILPQYEK